MRNFDDPLTRWEKLKLRAKFLRRIPGDIVASVKYKVRHARSESKKPRCPRCSHTLATAKAQQCLGCGLQWHGSPRPDERNPEFANWPRTRKRVWLEALGTLYGSIRGSLRDTWEQFEWELRRDRWRESDAWLEAEVDPKDVLIIKNLLVSHGYEYPIISIERIDADVLHITVGWQLDPLFGEGDDFEFRNTNDGWQIKSLGGWIS